MAGGETDYELSGLLQQAKVWDQQSVAMGNISDTAYSSQVTGAGGFFAEAVGAYNQVAGEIGAWCTKGQQQMFAICGALCTAARNYGATEQQIIQASNGAIH
jgi:hypothetical protein